MVSTLDVMTEELEGELISQAVGQPVSVVPCLGQGQSAHGPLQEPFFLT
jgi:hypothetical protein